MLTDFFHLVSYRNKRRYIRSHDIIQVLFNFTLWVRVLILYIERGYIYLYHTERRAAFNMGLEVILSER